MTPPREAPDQDEQAKLDIPELRASLESLYGLIDDGDMLLVECVPDLMDALDELERLRSERQDVSRLREALETLNKAASDRSLLLLISRWAEEYPEIREPVLAALRSAMLAADAALSETADPK